MRVVFLGDSITEARPGVSYVNIVQDRMPKLDISNRGKGGDTVRSIFRRIKRMDDLNTFDVFVLFVGINDIYGKLNIPHKMVRLAMNQVSIKDLGSFKKSYNELLKYLLKFNKKIIVIPPLLLGEDLASKWNQKVESYADAVKELATFYRGINFIDMRNIYVDFLSNKKTSNYLPTSLLSVIKDVDALKTDALLDSRSNERGLFLTLDGVHINSIGANIIAREIIYQLQRLK